MGEKSHMVPAWQAQTGSCTIPGWVYIFEPGQVPPEHDWPRVKCVDALLPVDPDEQRRLGEHRPSWMGAS